ncbi:MAG: hypothetical protein H7645_06100 [Candidatus Heimdallarchaeota archaeon]|nr:hypothetical protein [Candidatus Heimdallarchaeota archaeon]MCK4769894.1 hypothetical protein [Candidatus Heimdallarchaeota archaeon]
MTEKQSPLRSPVNMKLASLKDLVKLVISGVGLDRSAGYIGHFAEENRSIFFIFNTSIGYFELNALPIIVWVEDADKPDKSFIRFKTSPKEEMEFSNDASDPKWLAIPIVTFEILPDFLKVWEKKE